MAEVTFTKIGSYTVTGAYATSFTFSNSPQDYTDLIVYVSLRSSLVTTGYYVANINGDTSASLNYQYLEAAVASGTTYTGTGVSGGFGPFGILPNANSVANLFSSYTMTISNYTSNAQKAINVDGWCSSTDNNTGTQPLSSQNLGATYTKTSPVTSLVFTDTLTNGTFVNGSSITIYGVKGGAKATGGTITVSGGYVYHTFTQSGVFTPTRALSADYLIVGPGGGTKRNPAYVSQGGSGAGGVLTGSATLYPSSYSVLVGAGTPGDAVGNDPVSGNSWIVGPSAIAYGGGAGTDGAGDAGGSGGGGGWMLPYGVGGAGVSGQGNTGGNSYSSGGAGGGGGGAGAVGSNGTSGAGGAGGAGTNTYSAWHTATGTGVSGYIGGGGGGGSTGTPGAGGSGGGGAGNKNGVATNGTANTGGGGGGTADSVGGYLFTGASGGSGLIIIRYPL